jgi:hypothetical protein
VPALEDVRKNDPDENVRGMAALAINSVQMAPPE